MGDQGDQAPSKLDLLSSDMDERYKQIESNASATSNESTVNNDVLHGRIESVPGRTIPATQIPAPTTPSAAAIQRAMSVNKNPPSNADGSYETTKERLHRSGRSSPAWPTSPRLKSPPPSSIRPQSVRRHDNGDPAQSNTSIKRLAPTSAPELAAAMHVPAESSKDQPTSNGQRVSGRGGGGGQSAGLETVTESSVPTTPSIGPVVIPPHDPEIEPAALETMSTSSANPENNKDGHGPIVDGLPRVYVDGQDGHSASAPASRATSTSRPQAGSNLAKRSFTSLTAKKQAIEPLRSMTVETETVNSTPQLLGDRVRDAGGGVKAKPSTETIRPKKDKRKSSRKTPSLHAGTGTSKADIFEAKVASAVDEADSSDSDETFVYESNPPEPQRIRHHSRTPSATSMTSQVDHFGRGKLGVRGGGAAIPGKKSMKFSSSTYGTQLDADASGGDASRSSVRGSHSTPRHHHIGRHGRNGHASIIDTDSPFTQANKAHSPRTPTVSGHRYSRPDSPRTSNGRLASSRKSVTGGYDTYDDGADDERAPLIGSMRMSRIRHARRPQGQFRPMEFAEYPEPRCWPRLGGCLLLGVLIAFVAAGVATFMLALNRSLLDVEVRHVQNVLASEQELMVDLHVHAINPNLFAISVTDLDVDLFAESPYAGTSEEWRHRDSPMPRSFEQRRRAQNQAARQASSWWPPFGPSDGIDEGTDPIDDPDVGSKKLLLGRICKFDSPLIFEASPFRHEPTSAVGQIRLNKPGNKTVLEGSARWERVIQHPFDLIVRGVLKYQLPFSSHERSAKIGGKIKVSPDQDGDDGSNSTTIIRLRKAAD